LGEIFLQFLNNLNLIQLTYWNNILEEQKSSLPLFERGVEVKYWDNPILIGQGRGIGHATYYADEIVLMT
jgi:hypothetical protein